MLEVCIFLMRKDSTDEWCFLNWNFSYDKKKKITTLVLL